MRMSEISILELEHEHAELLPAREALNGWRNFNIAAAGAVAAGASNAAAATATSQQGLLNVNVSPAVAIGGPSINLFNAQGIFVR
jgi:hypothetical protein